MSVLSVNLNMKKKGMTLVEIILAMALLAVVVVLLTPVLTAGFKQIVFSGDRHISAKNAAGEVENILAADDVTETLSELEIILPGDISVNANKFSVSNGSGLEEASLDAYLIESMEYFDPTGTTTETSTESTTGSEPSESDPTESDPTETTVAYDENVRYVELDASEWRDTTNEHATLLGTNNGMQYSVIKYDQYGVELYQTEYIACSTDTTQISLDNNEHDYRVIIRQIERTENRHLIDLGKAPDVRWTQGKNKNFIKFVIWDSTNYRDITSSDKIEVKVTENGSFSYDGHSQININNTSVDYDYIFARHSKGYYDNDITIVFTDSFPVKVTQN